MSQRPISLSPDLQRLRDEGYDIRLMGGLAMLCDVPYVTADQQVARGILLSTLELAGDITTSPVQDHVASFVGETPCNEQGQPLEKIINPGGQLHSAPGVQANVSFSSKPNGGYLNYYDKLTAYARMLSGPAAVIDPDATAQTYPVVVEGEDDSVFQYLNTAASRAGIDVISQRLAVGPVAIVGLGGTGAYILDLLSKTPLAEIHLFDGDRYMQHNAFRSPGALSREELADVGQKVDHWASTYGKLHRHVIPHNVYVTAENINELHEMEFVFIAIDDGPARELIASALTAWGIPFIDVGMGVTERDSQLQALVRTTISTDGQRLEAAALMPTADTSEVNIYATNIQIADLNSLNATLAIIRFKQHCGFYCAEQETFNSLYFVDGNEIANQAKP